MNEAIYLPAPQVFQAGACTLPGRYYTDPGIFAQEMERIYGRRWLCAGRSALIERPGQYTQVEIGVESLILTRAADGKARAFFNVCRHRGTRLCDSPETRTANSIQCPYHAWTYALDGRLIGAPLMDEAPGFRKEDHGLHPAALAEWEGFLFVNLQPQAAPFESDFAPLAEKFSAWGLPGLRALRRQEYDVRANWKLIVQNYSECYHCPLIHPDLAARSPYRSGRNDLYRGPFLGGYMELNEQYGSLTLSGRACAPPLPGVAAEDHARVYYYSIFPNLLLSLHPDYVMAHTLWPQAPDRTRIVCEWLFDPAQQGQPGFNPDDAAGFWDMTNRQDWRVCELSQQGVSSRAYAPSPYAPGEALLAAFDEEYLRALEGEAA
jgi:Rieske 2Fe-2S family protein